MNLPRKLDAHHPQAAEWNRMVDWLRSLAPMQGPNVLTQHTPFGIIRKAQPQVSGVVTPAMQSGGTKKFQITTIGGGSFWDYFEAKEVTAGGLSSTVTQIAKQELFRPSIASQTWDGVQYDLTYTDDNNRTSLIHGTSTSETEICWPRFVVGAQIYCRQVPYTGVTVSGAALVWVDMDRQWQRVYGQ